MKIFSTIFFPFIFMIFNLTPVAIASPDSIYFYASQSGKATLDQGEGGGNPFASAFVDLLAHKKNLSFNKFSKELIILTQQKSNNYQQPEISLKSKLGEIFPNSAKGKRVALVFVFSDYSNTNSPSLPGTKNDLFRISKALNEANFEVQTEIDPTNSQLKKTLNIFSKRSKEADVAVIYTTGMVQKLKEKYIYNQIIIHF